MIKLNKKKSNVTPEIIVRTIWVSSFLALIFTLPALGIFLGIYFGTGNLLIGAILGFSVHFFTLAFSGRISNWLVKVIG